MTTAIGMRTLPAWVEQQTVSTDLAMPTINLDVDTVHVLRGKQA